MAASAAASLGKRRSRLTQWTNLDTAVRNITNEAHDPPTLEGAHALILELDQPLEKLNKAISDARTQPSRHQPLMMVMKAPIAVDRDERIAEQLRELLSQVDICLFSASEAEHVLHTAGEAPESAVKDGEVSLEAAKENAKQLSNLGVSAGIIHCEGQPAIVGFSDAVPHVFNEEVHLPRKIIETATSSDVFFGACLAELTRIYFNRERPRTKDAHPQWKRGMLLAAIREGSSAIQHHKGKLNLLSLARKHPAFRAYSPRHRLQRLASRS